MALKYIDIGANLTDSMFRGIYGGVQKHQNDFHLVLERAWKQGLQKMFITVGTLNEAGEALALSNQDERLFVTMGCHPTRCGEFLPDPEQYYQGLRSKISNNISKIIAIGECGLDYDRLHFCEKETQKIYFEKQLNFAAEFKLPLFLHCRNAHDDFMEILTRNRDKVCAGGVVHSFDGTLDEALKILSFDGLYIGLNGCSLKTAENLEVVKQIPNDKIMIETDCPWCGIRPSHASSKYVKTKFATVKKKEKWTAETLIDGRCEPCQISQVLEVIAGIKEQPVEKLANIFYDNTLELFFNKREY
ncbi:putative deoxyribonuclease TATDN1 [Teleopsis dalmanni]|uniref:putative deoxyribonuclease TATDN1 n=1 Tax=Teleopsis dalmanni TaxID=139649 RepID=UPI0018CD59F8|nr:putative deoxyribonuclease TATDN1 [Teleopsis dalmanni]